VQRKKKLCKQEDISIIISGKKEKKGRTRKIWKDCLKENFVKIKLKKSNGQSVLAEKVSNRQPLISRIKAKRRKEKSYPS